MKVISYSLFGDPTSFEFGYYLRGVYFNARMNRLLMPGFQTYVYVESRVFHKYNALWKTMQNLMPVVIIEESNNPQRCLGMLWRMKPLFDDNVELVLCRDADSVITYREALCNHEWVKSKYGFHAINDNAAHGGLMGGLVGFKSKEFKSATKFESFNKMVAGLDLGRHGSDQNWMNKVLHPKIKNNLMMHKFAGAGVDASLTIHSVMNEGTIDKKLWVADLISRYIGSAGVIDFELLRFFRDFDNKTEFHTLEKLFPNIFYWRL